MQEQSSDASLLCLTCDIWCQVAQCTSTFNGRCHAAQWHKLESKFLLYPNTGARPVVRMMFLWVSITAHWAPRY